MKKNKTGLVLFLLLASALGAAAWYGLLEPHTRTFDAEYVGAEVCGECHTGIFPEWQRSPHANMTREPSEQSVVGDFDDGRWFLPAAAQRSALDVEPAAKMYRSGDAYFMALRHPESHEFIPFEVAFVVGYQYRQVYVTQEAGGVLRRLPLQWSTTLQEYFPYWNVQEGSLPTLVDLWQQMGVNNSAWNLFCARCHTTHLEIETRDANHRTAVVHWGDNGIACEACHGPGSLHVQYFESNYINRVAAFLGSKLKNQPVAYVANARKLDKGRAMSVCARCHGSDILLGTTDIYRIYEPGNSREGRTNDLSPYFQQTPLEPGRKVPTVEVWDDGEPRGIGMLFRSLIESQCYQQAEVRCFSCHNPHDNKLAAVPGILQASVQSDAYCTDCHQHLREKKQNHSHHQQGSAGSFCYDCHMPRTLTKLATGVLETTRTHKMSSIPNPASSLKHGLDGAPNACNSCHQDQTAGWSEQWINRWYGKTPDSSRESSEAHLDPQI